MKKIELRDFDKRKTLGGQNILKFGKWYYFLLKYGFYRKAGEFYWSGESKKGIGLNPHIVENIPLDKLIIENRRNEKQYLLTDLEKALENHGKETQKGKILIVFPLSTFEEVQVTNPEKIPRKRL